MRPLPLPAPVRTALAAQEPALVDLRRERLVVLDAHGRVQATGQGGPTSVSPRRDEAARLTCCAGRIVTHNHPHPGGAFSAADLYLFAKEECQEVRAVTRTPDGDAVVYRIGRLARTRHTAVMHALVSGGYDRAQQRVARRRGWVDRQYLTMRQLLSLYDATVRDFAREHHLGYARDPLPGVARKAPPPMPPSPATAGLPALYDLAASLRG